MRLRSATLSRLVRPKLRLISALGILVLLSGVLAACGGGGSDVPGNAVASVDGTSITKDQFNHWMQVAAISSAGSSMAPGNGATVVPDPPSYAKCIAAKKKGAPKPAKGQPTTTDAQYKSQCQQEFQTLRDQVMSFLISAEWLQKEADKQNVQVSDKDVQKQLDQVKKQSFPKPADYQKFLKNSGMTQDDVLYRVKINLLSTKIRDKVTKGKDKVTQQQIADYYNKNKARFAQPERRDVRIVLTKTQAQAQQAKQAIQSGQSWASVAKKDSIDQASKAQGGLLSDVVKGQQEKALDDAIFSAKKGQLEGPIKTQFGWYVFQVQAIKAPSQQSLKDATPTIKQLLASQGQQKALDNFVKTFQSTWKAKTDCRSDYATQDCSNAPKKTTSTAATSSSSGVVTTGGSSK